MINPNLLPNINEHNYGTIVGEWICEKLWPAFMYGVGWCAAMVVKGLMLGLGFWFAHWLVNITIIVWGLS